MKHADKPMQTWIISDIDNEQPDVTICACCNDCAADQFARDKHGPGAYALPICLTGPRFLDSVATTTYDALRPSGALNSVRWTNKPFTVALLEV